MPTDQFSKEPAGLPFKPIPIVSVPFERMEIDTVETLMNSSAGHQYILVLVDYITQYPQAVLLRDIKASTLACMLAIIYLFCCWWIFSGMSSLTKELTSWGRWCNSCGGGVGAKALRVLYHLPGPITQATSKFSFKQQESLCVSCFNIDNNHGVILENGKEMHAVTRFSKKQERIN